MAGTGHLMAPGLRTAARELWPICRQLLERQQSSLGNGASTSSCRSFPGPCPSGAPAPRPSPAAGGQLPPSPLLPWAASSLHHRAHPFHQTTWQSHAAAAPTATALGLQQHQQVRHLLMMPRRIKYRKAHKSMGFNETIVPNTRQLVFGAYGIRAMEHARLPARTIEAARRTLRRSVKKTAMIWIRMTPNVPVTKKPSEVRMGKGKGNTDYYAAVVRPGQVMFELDRLPRKVALDAISAVQSKLPMRIGFLEWN